MSEKKISFITFSVVCIPFFAWMAAARPGTLGIARSGKRLISLLDSTDTDTLQNKKYIKSKRPSYVQKDRHGDEFSNKQGKAPMTLDKPKSVKTTVEIDTSGKYYRINETVDGVDYRPPTLMTFEQYKKYQQKHAISNYYRAKNKASDEKLAAKDNNKSSRALIPRIYMSPNMDRIFGGNYIDVKLNGSVLLDFGYRLQRTNNPSIPVRLRSVGGFFFDQQIQMNAQAKIGERLKITVNQDTKSQFDFDNNIKVEYSSLETDIIQKVEAGNVNMPLNTTLIRGASNLFGIKTTLKFGRLTATSIIANQRGRGEELKVQGGAQQRNFEVRADQYEDNRHYFMGHFFREKYEDALQTAPMVNSGVNITRVEVWVTNRNNTTDALRNVVAFMDLGENRPFNTLDILSNGIVPASNGSNTLFPELNRSANDSINGWRRADNTATVLTSPPFNLENGNDFEIMRGARRLKETEFKFHPQLGYISLNAPLGRDDVLGIAYEYSFRGQVYKVGELTEDYQKLGERQSLVVKLLRPSTIRTNVPMWDLQMKNIYSLGSNNISRENFQLRIVYRDDRTQLNNPSLQEGVLNGIPLVQVMNLDRLNMSNDPQPDGNFDFIDNQQTNVTPTQNPGMNLPNQQQNVTPSANDPLSGLNAQNNPNINNPAHANRISAITIDPAYGRIIFPVLEPFGSHLKKEMKSDTINRPDLIQKYIYNELYDLTKADALQLANKNKFFITGRMQSTATDEIQLQGFNIPPGSVKVFSGSVQLVENTDYTVDYNLGRVKIINPVYLMPGNEVRVQYDKPDLFQVRQRNFMGTRLDYVVSKDLAFGGTFLRLTERPLITRTALGDEPINNSIWGLDATYRADSRLITRIVDALPIIQTKEKSTFQVSGEFAQLIPDAPRAIKQNGEPNIFIDDFENTQIPFRLDNMPAFNWRIASTPQGFEGSGYNQANPLALSARRARMAWYVIDPLFYTSGGAQFPTNISALDMRNHYSRLILPQSIFPNRDRQQVNLPEPVMNIAYFPFERGPYNFNTQLTPDGYLSNPESNWAGITRAVNNYDTDFDNMNYQYLEFWLMDPFLPGDNGKVIDGVFNQNNTTGGKLVFHLGSVSEDVIKNGKHDFEQGLPVPSPPNPLTPSNQYEVTPWGRSTTQQFLTNAFSNQPGARSAQDVGLDGLNNDQERQFFTQFLNAARQRVTNPEALARIEADPAGDDFRFYLGNDQNNANAKITERYKQFNGQENNSPDNTSTLNASSYTIPDNEDLNQNNTLNDVEEYFKYELDLRPGNMRVGSNFIINVIDENVVDETGAQTNEVVKWYQFRIPLREGFEKVGNIENFKSIRFMRTILTGWRQSVVLRMAQFQLVALQWRPFLGDLTGKGLKEVIEPDDKVFTVSTVSVEENGSVGSNINSTPYVVPPGFIRDRDVNTTIARRQNEHSLRLCVDDLPDNDARAVFKNVNGLNLLNYKNVKMFVHAEADPSVTKDNDLTLFVRFGTDFTDNYYEIEMPLKLTNPAFTSDPNLVWPNANAVDLILEELSNLKLERDRAERDGTTNKFAVYPTYQKTDRRMLYIRGNPQYSNIQTIMIGIRNPRSSDRQPKSICIWANELRVTGFVNEPGWAATGRVNMKLADLGNVTATAKHATDGFGGLEQKISQRLQETQTDYGATASIQTDKFIPKNEKIGIRLPMFASYDHKNISPKFDPTNPDVQLDRSVQNKPENEREPYRQLVEDNTTRRSISFTNIQKVKVNPKAKKRIYDIENVNMTLGYSDIRRSNVNIEDYFSRNYKAGVGYSFSPKAYNIEPLKKMAFLKSPYLKLVKDVNLNPMPSNIMVRGDLDRTIIRTQYSNGIEEGRHNIGGILPTYEKRFFFNRTYGFGWALTKSIVFNYSATANAIVDEPSGAIDRSELRPGFTKRDSVIFNLQRGGRIKSFNQMAGVNYKVPLDKLPLTNWLSADARYGAGFTWTAGPIGFADSLGNNAQNNRDISINARADFTKLYNKWKFLSKINNPPNKNPGAQGKAATINQTQVKDTLPKPREWNALKKPLKFLMMLKSVNASYQLTQGTVLPGYLGTVKYLGMDDSRTENRSLYTQFVPFLLGDQDQYHFKNEEFSLLYMSRSQNISNPISQNRNEVITGRANVEPFKDFRIQLDNRIQKGLSYQEMFRFNPETGTFDTDNPFRVTTYSITFLSIQSFFVPDREDNTNATFNQFEQNRFTILRRLNTENQNNIRTIPPPGSRYDDTTSQYILIPAFIAAYSRQSADRIPITNFPRIPMPNWRVDYAGLPNILPSIKKLFPSINITHSYTSTYNTQALSSLRYQEDVIRVGNSHQSILPNQVDSSGVFIPVDVIQNVSIIDRFAPLLGLNLKTKTNITIRIEYRTDRNLNLNMSNKQLTDMKSSDIVFGLGYVKPNMKMPFKWAGREIVLKNDVTMRLDVTRRDTRTIQRRLEGLATPTAGNRTVQIRPNVAYQVNQRLTTQLYFEYTINIPKISNSFTRTSIAFGIQIRYSLS